MGEFVDKVKGNLNDAAGKVKEAIGEATGDKQTEAEGETQQLKGEGQKLKGTIKGALGDDI